MNLIDIVENAPEGAQRYTLYRGENEFVEYYAFINDGEHYYDDNRDDWLDCDKWRFTSAKPLPKLKTEYRKVEDSIWDLRPDFEAGELYYRDNRLDNGEYKTSYQVISSEGRLLKSAIRKDIYRRVESIMDEREEFKDKMRELLDECKDNHSSTDALGDFLYSRGCRFIG